jgi:polyhydroxyalkanoate synthesis repressor PhaR
MRRIIKRYENRKLYDAEDGKFVSLHDIAELIREGVDIKVIDKKTDQDISSQTLTQVIFEEGKRGRNPFSTEILHDVIRWNVTVLDGTMQQLRQKIGSLVPKPISKVMAKAVPNERQGLADRVAALEKMIAKLTDAKDTDAAEK